MPLVYFLVEVKQPEDVVWWTKCYNALRMIAFNSLDMTIAQQCNQAIVGGLDVLKAKAAASPLKVWMAIAAEAEFSPTGMNIADAVPKIVMCMTVSTADGIPFSTHMGIVRSPLWNERFYAKGAEEKIEELLKNKDLLRNNPEIQPIVEYAQKNKPVFFHPNISADLHAAAAKIVSENPNKTHMINFPRKNVQQQLVKDFGGRPVYVYKRKNDQTNAMDLVIEVDNADKTSREEITVISGANVQIFDVWLASGNYLHARYGESKDTAREVNVAVSLGALANSKM